MTEEDTHDGDPSNMIFRAGYLRGIAHKLGPENEDREWLMRAARSLVIAAGRSARAQIYIVTVIRRKDPDPDSTDHRSRSWGWFFDLDDAKRAVLANELDMFECDYTHAVIERVPEGVSPICETIAWFAATYPKGSDEPEVGQLDGTPAWARETCNWGIG